MVVPHENTVGVSLLGLEEHSRAEECWVGNDFIDCFPLKSIDAEVISIISIIASSSGPDVQYAIRNEEILLFITFNHR